MQTDSANTVPVVEVLSADKVFANGTRALSPIDLTIQPGEFITLLGPSGCGKSTLLKMIANLIEPSDGRLLWWRQNHDQVGSPGRKLVMGDLVEEEVESVVEQLGQGTTVTGFYSNGEISGTGLQGACALHNQTMTITWIAEA